MFVKFDESGKFESYSLVESIGEIRPDPTGFEPWEGAMPNERDLYYYKKVNGAIVFDEEAKQKDVERANIRKQISELKAKLSTLSEDIVQDQVGEIVPDIEARKAEFVAVHNELRGLLDLEPRGLK